MTIVRGHKALNGGHVPEPFVDPLLYPIHGGWDASQELMTVRLVDAIAMRVENTGKDASELPGILLITSRLATILISVFTNALVCLTF